MRGVQVLGALGSPRGFPDLTGTVEDVLTDGEKVAGRVTRRGRHRGDLMGVAGTGDTVEFPAFHIVRFSQGRAVEWWGTADLLGALVQVGARLFGPSEVGSPIGPRAGSN